MHPMYHTFTASEETHLWQGDLIHREELEDTGALAGHQDYMAVRSDFPAFCVITQTCDLMPNRRVDFITLAVVRELKSIFVNTDATGDRRSSTYSLLEKIINHRENKGFFYLHPYRHLISDEGAVVDLRTSFALHKQHYRQILECRKASLTESFAHTLGWMTGLMFARVPSKEWDEFSPREKSKQFVERLLDEIRNQESKEWHEEKPLFSFESAVKHLTPQVIAKMTPERWEMLNKQIETLHSRFRKNKPPIGDYKTAD